MTDDPGFRRETHATVEPTLEEQVAHWKARAEQAERERDSLMADTWRAFVESGGDPDGNLRWHCDAEMAGRTLVDAVRSLREDYDACPCPEDLQAAERERGTLRKALETTQCTLPISLFGVTAAPCASFAKANPSMPVTICDRCAALAAVSPPQEGEA